MIFFVFKSTKFGFGSFVSAVGSDSLELEIKMQIKKITPNGTIELKEGRKGVQ